MDRLFRFALLLLAAACPAFASARAAPGRPPATILVSIDGFRPDYLGRGATPVLERLAARGVVGAMRPSFPSITFPNHWTLVTGLRPDRTGIVGNTMEDPRRPADRFTQTTEDPFWWNDAEPIWIAAEKAGIRSAAMFWPGANVAWGGARTEAAHYPIEGGMRPEDWVHFDAYMSERQRVDGVLDWLRRPAATRPRFVTLYFERVDSAGHDFGPDDPRTMAAARIVDGAIGRLVAGLAALRQPANLVIVSDHGMAARSNDRLILLDALLPAASFHLIEDGAFAQVVPAPGHEEEVAAALLQPHDHLACWRKGDIPARFHFGANPRVAPFFCLADTGWEVLGKAPRRPVSGGTHGYDNDAPEMRALFLATGPAFRRGVRLATFDNVDVYPLLRRLLGLSAAPGRDGSIAPLRSALRR